MTGYRALGYKDRNHNLKTDRAISWIMVFTGGLMVLYPVILHQRVDIVLAVFGTTGLIFAIRDLRIYNRLGDLRENWLQLHLMKMIGGYIAAMTAFLIVNKIFPDYYGWFIPSILGTIYITYWMRKLSLTSR